MLVEVPEAGSYFIDEVVVVGDQQHRSLVALEGYVEGVDGFDGSRRKRGFGPISQAGLIAWWPCLRAKSQSA
jgi:hypothetical protein